MKKIKEYINKHQGIKKTLKILAVVGIILSVSFNILIIGVASCNNTHEAKAINEPIATTPIKRIADNGDYYIYSNYDVMHSQFIENVYYANQTYFNAQVLNSDLFLYGFALHYTFYGYLNLENMASTYDVAVINTIRFNCLGGGTWTSTTGHYVDYKVDFIGRNVGSNTDSIITSFTFRDYGLYETRDGVPIYSLSGDLFALYDYNLNVALYEYKSNLLFYGLLTDQRYNDQYTNGYNQGYGIGWHTGYDEGYSDGLNDRDSSPFGLIKSAFSSLVEVLYINLLPGISLAAIIFTPLIITIIIVIVKMFRG